VENNDYKVRLEIFEGPLDLLLYLIKKDELDIQSVSIERITRQYLDYINTFKLLNIDLASEFIVMAANLMYLKSRTLLPRVDQPPEEDAEEDDVETPLQNTEAEQVAYELDDYKPDKALPTDRLQYLSQLRSINPIYGLYLVNMLQFADESERIQALESVLELPPNIAKLVRVPPPDQMPAGPLASGVLHPQLLSLGLAVQEELLGRAEPEEPSDEQLAEQAGGAGGKYRKYEPYGEPPPRPLALAEKLRRLFDHEFPGVHDVFTRGVWVVGELLEFEGDFNKYIVARGLQKHEGLLFRHVLRFILLIEEIVQIAPSESSEADWEEPLYALVDRLVECCRKVDPESTDEILQGESKRSHDSAEKKS
jgi:hypothetical protein